MAREQELLAVCYDWMLEVACYEMWLIFRSDSDFDSTKLEFANGILNSLKYRNCDTIKNREALLLMLTTNLMNLKMYASVSDANEEDLSMQGHFQNILRLVADLSDVCGGFEVDTEIISEAHTKTLLQRIVESCRQNDYTEASTLFEEDKGHFDKEDCRKLQTMLNGGSDNKPSAHFEKYSMEAYLHFMKTLLAALYSTMPQIPIMIKHAEYYLSMGRQYKGSRDKYSSKQINDGAPEDMDDQEEKALQKKLKAIRKRKMREMIENVENINNNAEDLDINDDTPEGGGQSRSPGKHRRKSASPRRRKKVSNQRSHRSASPDRSSDSDKEPPQESDTDGENSDHSLQSRMSVKAKSYHKRQSLEPPPKPPMHHRYKTVVRRKWTEKEEREFYLAVQKYGVGNWQAIRSAMKTGRSNVQLKDKWRHIGSTMYKQMCKAFGPVDGH